jgi:hypothetical protein
MSRTLASRLPRFLLLLIGLSAPTRASTTLMVLVDWWQSQITDTIINLKVYQPTSEIKMVDGSTVPNPVTTDAYTTERRSWWYALPNFNADDYVQGRIRFNTTFLRGWYQNDSTYRASAGDTLFLPDTQTTFTYQKVGAIGDITATIAGSSPKFFVFPDSATYRGPKLYTSAGNSGTDILNQRSLGVGGNPVSGTGRLDKCIDSLKSDTVWIRWGTPTAPPGQMPSAAGMKCFGQNPFLTSTTSVRSVPRSSRPSHGLELSTDRDLRILPGGNRDVSGRKRLR